MKFVVTLAAVLALAGGITSAAQAAWIPGTDTRITVDEAEEYLEEGFDYAFCTGIKRYGYKRAEYSYENEYLVFDCHLEWVDVGGDYSCKVRMKAVKGKRLYSYRMKMLSGGTTPSNYCL